MTDPDGSVTPLLQIDNLQVQFSGSPATVLDGISLQLEAGKTLALVGESGCGKSVTSLALMGLLPASANVLHGEIHLNGTSLRGLSERQYADLRGEELAMIFQEPMTSLNPALRLGDQLAEAVMRHQNTDKNRRVRRRWRCLKKYKFRHRNCGWMPIRTSFPAGCVSA